MRFQVNCPSSSRHILYLKNKFYNFKNWERERYIKFWSNPLNFINKIFLLLDYSIFFLVKERRKVMSLDIFQRIDFTILCVVKGVFFYFFFYSWQRFLLIPPGPEELEPVVPLIKSSTTATSCLQIGFFRNKNKSSTRLVACRISRCIMHPAEGAQVTRLPL